MGTAARGSLVATASTPREKSRAIRAGSSTVQAIETARQFGFEIVGVMCLVEREEAGGRANVEKAAAPAPFVAVFGASEVRKEHIAPST